MPSLNHLARLLGLRPSIDPEQLATYAEAVLPAASQLGALYRRWRQELELDAADDELANAASIQRWEAAGLLDQLRQVQPPRPLSRTHAALQAVASDTARASQLLSNGLRFHSSRARCDGQDLMLSTEARFSALCRSLAERGISVEPAAGDGARRSW